MNHQTLYKYDASDSYYTKDTSIKFSHASNPSAGIFLRGKYTAAMSASSISQLIIQG